MTRTTQKTAEMLAELAEDLINDSGSEADLDLPEPDSFLIASPSTTQQKREIVLAPETPPSLPPKETDKELLLSSVNAVYSAKSTPRSSEKVDEKDTALVPRANSSRSLNEQFEQQKRKQPAKSNSHASGMSTKETESPSRSTRQKKIRMALDTMEPETPEPTRRKRSKRAAEQPATSSSSKSILATGLSDTQLKRIQRSIKSTQLSLTIHTTVAPLLASHTCTHLVAATGGRSKRATRTFKYLVGLTLGAQMVTPDWLVDSVKAGRWLDESNYAIEGDTALPQYRLSSSQQLKSLFEDYKLYVCCDGGPAYSRDDLVGLVRATGGTVVESLDDLPDDDDKLLGQQHASKKRALSMQGSMAKDIAKVPAKYRYLFELPTDTSRPIVLIDSNQLDGTRSSATLGSIVKTAGAQLPYRTTSWLFDCLSASQIC
ncbi:hypothetical protein IWW40_002019 [Coemansia sp. RSA 1250]|nr:hypothetical protein IWW40_002019 [Coemansia sp. RSA 1250]